jgi:hypothetical protein
LWSWRQRQADQLGQRRGVVGQVRNKIFVVITLDLVWVIDRSTIIATVIDKAVDRLLQHRIVGARR